MNSLEEEAMAARIRRLQKDYADEQARQAEE